MLQNGSKPLYQKIPWADPLSFLPSLSVAPLDCWVLLYSGMKTTFTGRYSFLALKSERSLKSECLASLEEALLTSSLAGSPLDNWFGYLGYGLKNSMEMLPYDTASLYFPLPNMWMVQYRLVLVFDHEAKQITVWAKTEADFAFLPTSTPLSTNNAAKIEILESNMTSAEYLQKVTAIQQKIKEGDLYQANLTRKFFGSLSPDYSPISIFQHLCTLSPAPYSALLKLGDCYILSSSPEQFINLDCDGKVSTRPIKGTSPRYADQEQDSNSKLCLQESEKNRAENLMIVDLMRNDFARGCKVGSVKVESLYDISSYATIHHLSSTISAQKKEKVTPIELMKYCFPPGSMTGAPKIKAMELCSQLEKQERGVYSGCIGWINAGGSADLSVVIRTLLLREGRFEFQVGGAIVADSIPEEERQETFNKAKAIAQVLGIEIEALEKC